MKSISIMAGFLLLSLTAFAQPGTKNFIDQPYIEVTGEAEKEVVPNEIYVNITINEDENPTKESLENLEKKMFAALKKVGVDLEKDLQVKDLSSFYREHWIKKTKVRTSKDYLLKVNNTTLLGKVFRELEALKISNLSIAKVDHSEMKEIKTNLMAEAVKAAKGKAEALAAATNQSIGPAIYIMEYQMPTPRYRQNRMESAVFYMKEQDSIQNMPELDFEAIPLEAKAMVRFILSGSVAEGSSGN